MKLHTSDLLSFNISQPGWSQVCHRALRDPNELVSQTSLLRYGSQSVTSLGHYSKPAKCSSCPCLQHSKCWNRCKETQLFINALKGGGLFDRIKTVLDGSILFTGAPCHLLPASAPLGKMSLGLLFSFGRLQLRFSNVPNLISTTMFNPQLPSSLASMATS